MAAERGSSRDDPDVPRPLARGVLSAGNDPRWLNQGTLKGAVLVLSGAVIVASPTSAHLWTDILGLTLVAWGVIDVVARWRGERGFRLAPIAQPVVLILAGLGLLFPSDLDGTIILGIGLVAFGLVDAAKAVRTPSPRRRDLIQVAVLAILMGGLSLALPETVTLGLRAAAGTAGILFGLILITVGLRASNDEELGAFDADSAGQLVKQFLRAQRLSQTAKEGLAETLYFEAPNRLAKLISFWVMMLLATAIASFAIIQDSTAVVIGAMLVAPLMTPIMGAAAATVNGWLGRFGASIVLTGSAVAVAIALSWLVAAWLPSVGDLATNAQIVSRVQPSLLDLCVAVAAGAAGAYATVDPRVSSSLSGVAVAVALVPPLAVVGITLQAGQYDDAAGAFLLFSTNFVSILLVGALVFGLTGFAAVPGTSESRDHARRVLRTGLIAAVIIIVPLSITSQSVWTTATDQASAETIVDDWLGDTDLHSTVKVDGSTVRVVLEGIGDPPDAAELEEQLNAQLDGPFSLRVSLLPAEIVYEAGLPGE